MDKKLKIGIIGATGYVGTELVRVLHSHPGFELTRLVSKSYSEKKYSDIYPVFRGLVDIECSDLDIKDISKSCDIVITALPHGVSSKIVPLFLENNIRVLDHSGDFRYKDVEIYEEAYNLEHPSPQLAKMAVYGLPEIYRDKIKDSVLVANPGCYPTCSLLALKPLLGENLIDKDSVIIDAYSGISGAGRKDSLAFSFCESQTSLRAYNPVGHRHTSEIEHIISEMTGSDIPVTFTPHLAPVKRGMLATIYVSLNKHVSDLDLHSLYSREYDNELFVRIMPGGECPDTKNVVMTNFADIGVFLDRKTERIVIFSAIDNLGKGAALQAVQSLNIMAGFHESTSIATTGGGV